MPIAQTRAMVRAALSGSLDGLPTQPDPVFGLAVPVTCPGVPETLLNPRATWTDPAAYDSQADRLRAMFARNFALFADQVPPGVRAAGPHE
jgi:phosphoenolpyruvate carboxykinase (ATP)